MNHFLEKKISGAASRGELAEPSRGELAEPSQKEIQKELEKFPEAKPKLAAFWPLSENRKNAIEMVEKQKINEAEIFNLIESGDFVERGAGFYLLSQIQKPSKNFVKQSVRFIESMDLRKLAENRDVLFYNVGHLGKDSLPFIQKVLDSSSIEHEGKEKIFHSLEILGENGIPFLKNIIESKETGRIYPKYQITYRLQAIEILGRIGKKALPILENIRGSNNPLIEEGVAAAEKRIAEQKMKTAKHELPKGEDAQKMRRLKFFKSKKPLFAAVKTSLLSEDVDKLDKIKNQLKKQFGDEFVGFTVGGSFYRGYYNVSSDIDYAIIASDAEINTSFPLLLYKNGLKPCEHKEMRVFINPNEIKEAAIIASRQAPFLFSGIFFGDYKKLVRLQAEYLKNNNEEDWEITRFAIHKHEARTRLEKIKEQLGLNEAELEEARRLVALRRTPPPLEEARKVIYKRNRQLNR